MSLFGKMFGSGNSPRHGPASSPPQLDFTVDRERMFNLDLTRRLQQLIAIPADQRDEAWDADFFPTVWNASIELPQTNNPFMGPDRFDYLRIDLPAPGAFESNSLANVAEYCVEQGCGAVLFPHPEAAEPAYVMSMGVLESLLRYGDWRGDPIDIEESRDAVPSGSVTLEAGATVLIGAPSKDYLSPYAARALDRYLEDDWKIADARVSLMTSAALSPSRSLVVNRRLGDFENEEQAQYFARCVGWFLPPSRAVMLLPEDWTESQMTPLANCYDKRRAG